MAMARLFFLAFALVATFGVVVSCGRDPQGALTAAPPPGGSPTRAEPDRSRVPLLGEVAASRRALIVVSELSAGISRDRAWIYESVEAMAVSQARTNLAKDYLVITPLLKADATLANFERTLTDFAVDERLLSIDVLIHLHGHAGTLRFFDGSTQTTDLALRLGSIAGLSAKLRAVYSAACHGASHLDDWLASGFRVASGSEGNNANTAYELPSFLALWSRGATFGEALFAGDEPQWRRFYDSYAIRLGLVETANSHKLIKGVSTLRIDSSPNL